MTQFGFRPSLHSDFFPPVRGNVVTPKPAAVVLARKIEEELERWEQISKLRQFEQRRERRHRVIAKVDALLGYEMSEPRKTLAQIVREVADAYGVTVEDMKSERRSKNIVLPRQEAFYRCRHETRHSLPTIGRFMGGRDHTTVIHGIKRHAARIAAAGLVEIGHG